MGRHDDDAEQKGLGEAHGVDVAVVETAVELEVMANDIAKEKFCFWKTVFGNGD